MKKLIMSIMLLVSISQAAKTESLYDRLGGYDAIAAISKDFHYRLKGDAQLGRYWAYRGTDGLERELQLLIDFTCASAGGPTFYAGRDMPTTHIGMKITQSDWNLFMLHLKDTLKKFKVKKQETADVVKFIESLKSSIVEVN